MLAKCRNRPSNVDNTHSTSQALNKYAAKGNSHGSNCVTNVYHSYSPRCYGPGFGEIPLQGIPHV